MSRVTLVEFMRYDHFSGIYNEIGSLWRSFGGVASLVEYYNEVGSLWWKWVTLEEGSLWQRI